jgi:hypothetical protein
MFSSMSVRREMLPIGSRDERVQLLSYVPPLLLKNEREAVADLLQFLKSTLNGLRVWAVSELRVGRCFLDVHDGYQVHG